MSEPTTHRPRPLCDQLDSLVVTWRWMATRLRAANCPAASAAYEGAADALESTVRAHRERVLREEVRRD